MTAARRLCTLLAIAVAACASHDAATPRDDAAALRAATQRYAELVQRMDHAAVAAMFAPGGQIVATGRAPIRGPVAIRKYLESFKDFHVESETMTADSVTVDGAEGYVSGNYRQRVRVPAGDVVEVHGSYTAEWLRGADGVWRIQRIATTAQR